MLREELGKGIFLVAEQDGRTAGYCVGCQTVLDEGYITNVAVSPDFRRQGHRAGADCRADSESRRKQLAFVTLEVRESNAPAIALTPEPDLCRSENGRIFTAIPQKTRF